MWVTHSERAWRRKEEARALAEAARQAEARIAGASGALAAICVDAEGSRILANACFLHAGIGRSSRHGKNGRAEGLSVLEGVVVGQLCAHMLSEPKMVRWLLANIPSKFATLSAAASTTHIETGLSASERHATTFFRCLEAERDGDASSAT